jgi:hypothetical protein
MKTNTPVLPDADAEDSLKARANEVDMARSARNVAEWLTYLPQDCVAAMIRQGWDRSVC